MSIKIKPEVIIEKVLGYIKQLEELKKASYSRGNAKMYSLDANIKSFFNSSL